jgi:hypothetical protein
MNVNTNTFQTGFGCALGFGTMQAHKSTVTKKMAGMHARGIKDL